MPRSSSSGSVGPDSNPGRTCLATGRRGRRGTRDREPHPGRSPRAPARSAPCPATPRPSAAACTWCSTSTAPQSTSWACTSPRASPTARRRSCVASCPQLPDGRPARDRRRRLQLLGPGRHHLPARLDAHGAGPDLAVEPTAQPDRPHPRAQGLRRRGARQRSAARGRFGSPAGAGNTAPALSPIRRRGSVVSRRSWGRRSSSPRRPRWPGSHRRCAWARIASSLSAAVDAVDLVGGDVALHPLHARLHVGDDRVRLRGDGVQLGLGELAGARAAPARSRTCACSSRFLHSWCVRVADCHSHHTEEGGHPASGVYPFARRRSVGRITHEALLERVGRRRRA